MDLTPELCPATTSQSDTYPECEALQPAAANAPRPSHGEGNDRLCGGMCHVMPVTHLKALIKLWKRPMSEPISQQVAESLARQYDFTKES